MINIVLFRPEKPLNVGSIGRTCVLTASRLHIIKPITFDMSDKQVKRGGMDYWPNVDLHVYESFDNFLLRNKNARVHVLSTKAEKIYTEMEIREGDFFLYGRESSGLPPEIHEMYKEESFRIPMIETTERSLNLSNTVAVVTYEALKNLGFPGMK